MLAHNPIVIPWELGSLKRKKLNLRFAHIVDGNVGIAIPTFLPKSRQLGIVDFFNNPNFSGIGIAIPVLKAEACMTWRYNPALKSAAL